MDNLGRRNPLQITVGSRIVEQDRIEKQVIFLKLQK